MANPSDMSCLRKTVYCFLALLVSVGRSKKTTIHMHRYPEIFIILVNRIVQTFTLLGKKEEKPGNVPGKDCHKGA